MIDHLDDPIAVNRVGPSLVVSFGRSHDDRMLITRAQAQRLASDLVHMLSRDAGEPGPRLPWPRR